MRIVTIVLSIMLAGSSAMAAGNCHVDNYRFVFGQEASASMTAKSGTPCTSHINDAAGIRSSEIEQQPSNGTAMIPDKHRWGYKSRPGYTGPDTFVVAIDGTSSSGNRGRVWSGVTKLSVSVNVVP